MNLSELLIIILLRNSLYLYFQLFIDFSLDFLFLTSQINFISTCCLLVKEDKIGTLKNKSIIIFELCCLINCRSNSIESNQKINSLNK